VQWLIVPRVYSQSSVLYAYTLHLISSDNIKRCHELVFKHSSHHEC